MEYIQVLFTDRYTLLAFLVTTTLHINYDCLDAARISSNVD